MQISQGYIQWRSQLDNWGGGHINILVEDIYGVHRPWKQSISKEINNAEHEYMNMTPPPPIIELATPLGYISSFYNISQPNFAMLLILKCSF